MMGDGGVERYRRLGLAEALGRAFDYAAACTELSFILRGAYPKLPKSLQSLVFQDTLAAFRLLPDVQTSSGTSAAYLLHQASEASLPKQKKAMAVSEFKHAVVAQKRRCKVREDDEGARQLPKDILIHIFSFLDLRSLVYAGLVCRLWNSAANDNTLWQLQYSLLFGNCCTSCESKTQMAKSGRADNIDWRKAFERKYICYPSWRSTVTRVFCGCCESIIWASNISLNSHKCSKLVNEQLRIRPLSPNEVVRYLLGDPVLDVSDSSDSDSDDSFLKLPKLWAYPTLLD
uniref:F-box protein At5g52880 n=1 Tax=Anthurium amnicola TaxID=1678845 RepID=A0A1D1Y8V1_9ARAE